jgi:hypothetical protein
MVTDFIQTIDAVQGLAELTRPGRAWYEDMAPQMIDHIVAGLMGCLATVSETIDSVGDGFFSDEEIELLAKAEEIAIDLAIHRGARGIDMNTGEELKGDALKAKMMELRKMNPNTLGKFREGGRVKAGDPVKIPDDLVAEIQEKLKNSDLDPATRTRLENIIKNPFN